ncbi:MAG: hypothetical protein M5R41_00160 [Bacteroidia bacterium]|nr:hypothetical protein [Bacteroidia bacterium]
MAATRRAKYVFVEITDDRGQVYEITLDYITWGNMKREERLQTLSAKIKKGANLSSYQFKYIFKQEPVVPKKGRK